MYEILEVLHITDAQYMIDRAKTPYVTIVKRVLFETENGKYELVAFFEEDTWKPCWLYHRENGEDCSMCGCTRYNEDDLCGKNEELDELFEELKILPELASEFSVMTGGDNETVLKAVDLISEVEDKINALKDITSGFEYLKNDLQMKLQQINGQPDIEEKLNETILSFREILDKYPYFQNNRLMTKEELKK